MSSHVAVLDANVLVPACLRDTLLRQAEEPRLFIPKWSDQIIEEMVRALETKLSPPLSREKTQYLVEQLREHFPEAWLSEFEVLIPAMQNNPKDKHVLAAAVKGRAETIVTFDARHFPEETLRPWGIAVQHPDEFLVHQYHLDPELVHDKLALQAADIDRPIDGVLATLQQFAPQFVALVSTAGSSTHD
jgi:predicted nucleic acid-binding protein